MYQCKIYWIKVVNIYIQSILFITTALHGFHLDLTSAVSNPSRWRSALIYYFVHTVAGVSLENGMSG